MTQKEGLTENGIKDVLAPTKPGAKGVAVGREQFWEALQETQFRTALARFVKKEALRERMLRIALLAADRTPTLYTCTAQSVRAAVLRAAELGLEAGGALAEAYLVPYWNNKRKEREAVLIVSYQGLMKLARKSGFVKTIEARPIYKGEHFRCRFGLNPVLEHEVDLQAAAPPRRDEDIIGAYLVAELSGGGKQVEVMTRQELDAARTRSKAKDEGPWVTDFAEMCRKTVVRRGAKYLPKDSTFAQAFDMEDAAEDNVLEVEAIPTTGEQETSADTESSKAPPPPPEADWLTEKLPTKKGEIIDVLKKCSVILTAEYCRGVLEARHPSKELDALTKPELEALATTLRDSVVAQRKALTAEGGGE